MAATATLNTPDGQKGTTERGQRAFHGWDLSFPDASAYLDIVMDTLDVGALAVGFYINNKTADGALTGVKFTPQISMDGVNWTNVKWKDEAGSETASGETIIAQNTTQYVCIHFAAYPEYLCARYFRLHTKPSTNVASVYHVYACVK